MEKVLGGKKVRAGLDGLLTSPGAKKIGKNYEDYSCVCVCVCLCVFVCVCGGGKLLEPFSSRCVEDFVK